MRALVLLIVLAAAPLAAAQSHEHQEGEGLAAVLHDGPPDGRAVVGGLTHFGFALLDGGVPQTHRDAAFTVLQDGRVVFATTDTHEYDGLFSFDVVFTRPGPYEVWATSEGMTMGMFSGTVVERANETEAQVVVELAAGDALPATSGFSATIAVVDAAGALIPHTDAIVELRERETQKLVTRARTHIHDAPMVLRQYLPRPGDYDMTVTAFRAFPSGRSADMHAIVTTVPVSVGPLPEGAGVQGVGGIAMEGQQPLDPRGPTASADGYALHGMLDPQALVGVGNVARMSAILVDESGSPVQHVDFRFELRGPTGLLFHSETLHEYDGVFEFAFVPAVPGGYTGALVAAYNETELAIQFHAQAAPPAAPLDAGAFRVTLEGLEGAAAGTPTNLTFGVFDDAGRPLTHSEVEVEVRHDGEAAVYRFKLHTHDSGTTAATIVFPHGGPWEVFVEPIALLPQASLAAPARFAVDVTDAALPAEDIVPLGDARRPVPALSLGPVLALVMASLAVAAFGRRP